MGTQGMHLLHQMGRHLRHAPSRTGGTKAALLTAERQQHLVRTGVTAQADKAVGQDAALQVGVEFLHHILRQAFGGGIGREGAQKGFEMVGNDLVEDRATGSLAVGTRGGTISWLTHDTQLA